RQASPEPRMRPAEPQADASGAGDDGQSSIRVRRAGSPVDPTRDTLDSARRALARGRPEIAIAQLQEELEREPRSVDARVLLARTLAATGRAGRAEQVLEEGLEAGPELSAQAHEAAFWLARMRMQRGAVQSAATVLAAHRPSRQGHADYHLLEAAALRELGRHDQALAAYRAVAEAEPANGRAWLGAGLSHEALDQLEAAAAAYARAAAGDHAGSAAFAAQRLQALEYRRSQPDPSNPNR
ncbi:MAG: tetratricopeptide repeat protein, partial [Wenzhouxiangellaceae bacterium]